MIKRWKKKLECLLREKCHWQVPTYTLPNSNIVCQRLVIRTDVTLDLANKFVADLQQAICCLQNKTNPEANSRFV